MAKNFFNLPPSWNPGYAIPRPVMDEGLERRAFVTAETRRGTYDDPKVGNGGYAVPQYVDEEGYGQGTTTTAMLPRGYIGPGVPHWLDGQFGKLVGQASLGRGKGVVMAMQTPMGDTTSVNAGQNLGMFGAYGRRAAATLITAAKKFPPNRRVAVMKHMMDRIDPTLHGRAKKYASAAAAQGQPPTAALAHGIATAMTEGMLTELHKVGKSRTAPQARSLLGLGCYGCAAALGATAKEIAATTSISPTAVMTTNVGTTVSVNPNLINQAGGSAAGQFTSGSVGGGTLGKGLMIGPFNFPLDTKTYTPPSWTPAQLQWIADSFPDNMSVTVVNGRVQVAASKMVTAVGVTPWQMMTNNRVPFLKFVYPTIDGDPNSGKQFGVFVSGLASTTTKLLPTSGLMTFQGFVPSSLQIRAYTPSGDILGAIWDAIKTVFVAVYDVVKDVGEVLGQLACGTITAPGAAATATAASGGAAGIGVAIAGGICSGQTPQPPPPPPVSDSLLPLALIGGGALVILAINKKKGSTP